MPGIAARRSVTEPLSSCGRDRLVPEIRREHSGAGQQRGDDPRRADDHVEPGLRAGCEDRATDGGSWST
jgi:hypothetical protein